MQITGYRLVSYMVKHTPAFTSPSYSLSIQLSKAPAPATKITTKLLTINKPAMTLTSNILPLLAGNFPRMT
jgi:hypothetical protein